MSYCRLIYSGYYQKAHRGFLPDIATESTEFIGDMGEVFGADLQRLMDDPCVAAVIVGYCSRACGFKNRAVKVVRAEVGFEVGFYETSPASGHQPDVRNYANIRSAVGDVSDWFNASTWRRVPVSCSSSEPIGA